MDVVLNLDNTLSVNAYVSRLNDILSMVVEAVKKHQMNAFSNQKRNFDFKVNFQYYSLGEWIWLKDKTRKQYEVMARISEVLYEIKQRGRVQI